MKPAKNKLQVLEMSEENKFTWTVKAAPPSQDEGAACAVVEGRLLSAGWSDRWGRTISVSIYDPASDSWSAGPALPHRKGLFDGFFKAAPYKAATHEGQVRLFSLRGPELAYRDGAWLRITGGLEFGVRVNVCDAFESVLLG